MSPERWQQLEQLYHAALERPPDDRAAFLQEACADDVALRHEVEALLASHDRAASFIEAPPADIAAGMLAEKQARSLLGRTFGHYELQALLGAGGMGEVYRARDIRLDRAVAVKILPAHLAQDAEALRRFEREAKSVAALSHPNILAIFDFGTEDKLSYAVTELLEGETLRARLKRAALPWRETVGITLAVAEGLDAAHAKGIIHRDIKPENIFLTSSGQVKILDFGIARVKRAVLPDVKTLTATSNTTRPGVVMGTLGYMSPEQVRGEQADAPSDIFSLGCVLYELIGGHRPFEHETAAEVLAAILHEAPPSLSRAGQQIPAELERVFRHCLAKQPGERYQTARELAADLKVILGGSNKTLAAPALARQRMRPAVLIVAAVVMVLLGLSGWFYLSGREGPIDSLAVLPLLNASGDADAEYLSDGITEGIVSSLSQLPQLKRVIAQSTMASYKGKPVDPRKVGQELNVRAVLTGRMTQQNDTLIVWAELVNVADGARLWAGQYSQQRANLFALQGELAQQISAKLRLALTGEQQKRLTKHYTENAEAYRLYLQGYYYSNRITPDGFKKGIEFLNQAIELDPANALSWAGLASSYAAASDQILPASEALPKVKAAAQRALELDETLGEAHTWLAYVRSRYEWARGEAEQEYKRAIELNPSYAPAHQWYGWHLAEQGRMEEAIAEMTRAYKLDPLTPWINTNLAWFYYLARQPDEAVARLRKISATDPAFLPARPTLGLAYEQKGMFAEAIAELNQARLSDPEDTYLLALLGHVYGLWGRRAEAQRMLEEVNQKAKQREVNPTHYAIIYAGLGEKDQAFAWLEKGYAARLENMLTLKVEPLFDSLRSDPRFTDLLRRLNLPQ